MEDEENDVVEEFRKSVAADLGQETADVSLDSLLGVILLDTISSDYPKMIIENGEIVVAMFVNSPKLRGKYLARLNKNQLRVFRAGETEPIAIYACADIQKRYNEIQDKFYPWER